MNIVISSEPGLYVVQRGDELAPFGSSVAPSVAHQLAMSTDSSSSAGVDVFALRSSQDSSPPCVAPAAARGAHRSVTNRADSVVCKLDVVQRCRVEEIKNESQNHNFQTFVSNRVVLYQHAAQHCRAMCKHPMYKLQDFANAHQCQLGVESASSVERNRGGVFGGKET